MDLSGIEGLNCFDKNNNFSQINDLFNENNEKLYEYKVCEQNNIDNNFFNGDRIINEDFIFNQDILSSKIHLTNKDFDNKEDFEAYNIKTCNNIKTSCF